MASKKDGDGSNILSDSNILSFPGPSSENSVPIHVRENIMTAEGLRLMRAFFKIASIEDRKKVIALAERLGERDDQP